MSLVRDEAVVLRTYKLGEADRIVVLFGQSRGKIRAVAKGVRRTKSKFGARLEPGSVVAAQFYEGRNLDIITEAQSVALHPRLRTDLDAYGRAAVMLEVVDQVGQEGEADRAIYKLLTGALAELERSGNPLVVPAFVAKLLVFEGVQPLLDRCVSCGATDPLVAIELHLGGVLCHDCKSGEPISPAAREALIEIFEGRVRQVLERTDEATARELENLGARMIEQHVERRLRSSTVLYQHLQS
ncbi:MAG: DNA repair protein RecO [Acidimicrobiales bacterium]